MRRLLIILGVPIDDLTMEQALDRIDGMVAAGRREQRGHQIATINADFVVKSLHDANLREILQNCDMATADGMPLVWGARMLGVPIEGRVTGADLVPAMAERAAQRGYSIYMLGAAPGVAQRAADRLTQRFPGLKIAGVLSPPVRPLADMDPSIITSIRAARPDILLVAFGNPKQEKWIAMHAAELRVPVMIGVGGTFDFLAGLIRRAPAWMQRTGLEWIYRLLQEPRRLWRRYVVDLAGFGFFFLRQWLAMRQSPMITSAIPRTDTLLIGQHAVLRVIGRLDVGSLPTFNEQIEAATARTSTVVLDLSRASFLDSATLGTLVRLAKLLRERGGDLVLASAPDSIRDILRLIRLDRFFVLHDTVEAALGSALAPSGAQQAQLATAKASSL